MINYQKIWSYKKVKIIVAIFSVIIIYSLYSAIDYKISRVILEDIKLDSQKDSLTIRLKEMMQDSVMKWHKSNRRFFTNYNIIEDWYWEDIIIFNNEKTKGFSFIYSIDKSNSKRTFDNVEYYLVYKMNNIWYFYTDTPTLGFHRNDNNDKPHTKEILQEEMYEDLVKYVNILDKNIDNKIVDEWFENESVNSDELRALLGKKLRK